MTNEWTHLHAQLHRTLLHRKILPPNQRYLVAVSGGQDSLCLLKLLLDLQPKWGWELAIAHCDHRWRSDSEASANHVEQLAENWGISYYLETADRVAKTEADARQWRYQSLTKIAIAHNYPYIVTGHTQSDRAETLLYNLIRGSGADGLSALTWQRLLPDLGLENLDGNPQSKTCAELVLSPSATLRINSVEVRSRSIQNPKLVLSPSASLRINSVEVSKIYLVRPLLEITRSQTGEFCQEQKLPIWEDSTNQDLQYARNRIRSELLPYLETHFNPKVQQALAQTAELLRADVEYLELAASELLQRAREVINEPEQVNCQLPVKINRLILRDAPQALQRRAIRQLLQQILPTAPSFESVEKLTGLIVAPNRSQTDPFPGGAIARVEHRYIIANP